MSDDYKDALATVRGDVLMAVAATSPITGLKLGPQSEALVDEIVKAICEPCVGWALRAIADHHVK